MGIIDELREETNKKLVNDSRQKKLEQQLAKNYLQDISPKMQHVFKFIKEILEHISFLDRAIEIKKYSDKYPELGTLRQVDYKINTDGNVGFVNYDEIMQINVNFACVGEGEFSFKKEGKTTIDQEIAFLHEKKVPFSWNYIRTLDGVAAAHFKIKRSIPVKFRFEVDYQQSKIILLINNHLNFDSYKKVFEPSEINQNLLDEIARYMLREDNEFIQLEISNKKKQAIRQKLDKTQREQIELLKQIHADELGIEKKQNKFLQHLNTLKNNILK